MMTYKNNTRLKEEFPVRDKNGKQDSYFLFQKKPAWHFISVILEILRLRASNTVSYLSMNSFRERFRAVKRQSPVY